MRAYRALGDSVQARLVMSEVETGRRELQPGEEFHGACRCGAEEVMVRLGSENPLPAMARLELRHVGGCELNGEFWVQGVLSGIVGVVENADMEGADDDG